MIKVVVVGAAGRMGNRLVALIKDSADLALVGAVEGKGHQALGQDAGETAGCGKIGARNMFHQSAHINIRFINHGNAGIDHFG